MLPLLALSAFVGCAVEDRDARERAISTIETALHLQALDAYCRAAPDIIDYLHRHDGLSFADAARRANVAIDTSTSDFLTIATRAAVAFKDRRSDPDCRSPNRQSSR